MKPVKSSDARELQYANISHMLVTFSVLKPVKSSDARERQE